MFNLHETSHYLASQGVGVRFTLPLAPSLPLSAEAAHTYVDRLSTSISQASSSAATIGNETERSLAERQQRVNNELFERMHEMIREDLGR